MHQASFAAAIAAAMALVATARSSAAELPTRPLNDTGMTRCVDPYKTYGALKAVSVRCRGTAQDGEFGRDVTHRKPPDGAAGFSFARVCGSGEVAGQGACPQHPALGPGRNDWACTQDRVTGLLWEVKTSDGGPRDAATAYTNLRPGDAGYGSPTDAAGYVSATNTAALCGSRHWRVPQIDELQSIVNFGLAWSFTAGIDPDFFPNGITNSWSSTSNAAEPDEALYQQGSGGSLDLPRTSYYPFVTVRLVSGEWGDARRADAAPLSSVRFQPSADADEVLDTQTGLVWRRCAIGQTWNGLTCADAPQRLDWFTALTRGQLEAGQTGKAWRLPNVKELGSIVDHARSGTALIDPQAFPATSPDYFWTSTPLQIQGLPDRYSATNGWYVHFASGYIFQGYLSLPQLVRLVRNAD